MRFIYSVTHSMEALRLGGKPASARQGQRRALSVPTNLSVSCFSIHSPEHCMPVRPSHHQSVRLPCGGDSSPEILDFDFQGSVKLGVVLFHFAGSIL